MTRLLRKLVRGADRADAAEHRLLLTLICILGLGVFGAVDSFGHRLWTTIADDMPDAS